MRLHLLNRSARLALIAAAVLTSPLAAQRTVPPAPATYDVQLRYSIRAGTNQRIALFQDMMRHLESLGFHRTPTDDELEAADHSAERLSGTLPSENVRKLLHSPHIRNVLLIPAGMKLPENPDERVLVQIELESRLSPTRQRELAQQARARLAGIGFVEKVGYDHQGNVRLLGTVPSGEVESLLRDLRDLPAGWLAPDVPRADLPEPIRDMNPIRIVEVLRDPDGAAAKPDAAQPVATDSTLEKLPLDLRDAEPNEVLRLDAILSRTPASGDPSWRALFEKPGVTIEGRLGPVVAIRGPAGVAKELVVGNEIATVRRAAAATRQPAVPKSAVVGDAVARSGLTSLAPGNRGRNVSVAIIDSDFRGADRIVNNGRQSVSLVDLTAARNSDLLPDPYPEGDAIGSGTQAALAARLAAPEANLILVRVDRAAAYMIGDVARYLHGDARRPENLVNRNRELLSDHEQFRIARQKLHDELAQLAADFRHDDEATARRKKLAEQMIELDNQEKQYLERLMRFTRLEDALVGLRSVLVVVGNLEWDIGYPVDGTGPLSRVIDEVAFARASLHMSGGLRYWMQSAGDTRGQVWNESLIDSDGNGVFEFAPPAVPLPRDRWTREVNFLAWAPTATEKPAAELPANARIRVALQWTEAHDPQADVMTTSDPYRTPLADIRLSVLRQRDPSGKSVASDDFVVVARSAKLPEMIERTPTLATYEQIVEFTVDQSGAYALRLEGVIPPTTRPADTPTIPAINRRWEPRGRLFVETTGPADGRPVFADFSSEFGGLGTPGDAITPRTIGAANSRGEAQPYSASGPASGRDLLAKPTFLTFDQLPLPGGVQAGGTGCAAGFAGGIAASMISAGAPPEPNLRWLGIQAGNLLVVPHAWLDQLRTRGPALRP